MRLPSSGERGAALREYRLMTGWTLRDAAAYLGCSPSKVSRIETGRRGIDYRELGQLFSLYKVPAREQARLTIIGEDGAVYPKEPLPDDAVIPHVARMYDYALGGKDNYRADREAAEILMATAPEVRELALDNRGFLQRAVRYAAQSGIGQFLDIGSGLPTVQNTHEVAQAVNPDAQVIYVDNDPVVAAHGRALLESDRNVSVCAGDLREPDTILKHAGSVFDLGQPVAVMLVAVLHFIGAGAYEIVGTLKQAMAPGSYLILSHATADNATGEETGKAQAVYEQSSHPLVLRSAAEIFPFFDGLALIEPGLTGVREWRNKAEPARVLCYGAVGRKG